ncbi:MAG: hypothetical protein NC938_02550 [Candidatus Omnitrophica bacterium]|nr:hypothetical protein [Candidatus Omnitrophota bacterium]MCM8790559.1 hypothetical protein [Candidatus Omnitrophota bacterium]
MMIRHRVLKILLLVWIILWLSFTGRELFIKGNLHDYQMLMTRSLEEKRSYVTGDSLYELLTLCNERTPADVTYSIIGIEEGSLDKRRAAYYLYPRLESNVRPDIIIVYNKPGVKKAGYTFLAGLDDSRYVLRIVK